VAWVTFFSTSQTTRLCAGLGKIMDKFIYSMLCSPKMSLLAHIIESDVQ
jgi:hypothetical protein